MYAELLDWLARDIDRRGPTAKVLKGPEEDPGPSGLNLRADRFGYVDSSGRRFGAERSPVQLRPAWQGDHLRPWPGLELVESTGCDLSPVDATTTEGRVVLTAYVWPDQRLRPYDDKGPPSSPSRWTSRQAPRPSCGTA